jgi:hypothetical protein
MQKPEEPRITRMSRMDTCVPPDRDALQIAYAIHRALRIDVINRIRGLFCFGANESRLFEARLAAQRMLADLQSS